MLENILPRDIDAPIINPHLRSEKKWIYKNKKFYLITVDSERSAMNITSLKRYLKSNEILCVFGSLHFLDVLKGKIPLIPISNNCNREDISKRLLNFEKSLVEASQWT